MGIRKFAGAALITALIVAAPSTASADWMFTPFIGVATGGGTAETTPSFGAGLTWMGAGAVGFDFDFGYTPDFFGSPDDDVDLIGDNNVTTLMLNAIVGAPVGGQSGPGIRPYGLAGLGLIRERIDDADDFFDVDANSWGFNVGAGVAGFFTDNIGIRGDARYFRTITRDDGDEDDDIDLDLGALDFWRVTVGVTFRFGG